MSVSSVAAPERRVAVPIYPHVIQCTFCGLLNDRTATTLSSALNSNGGDDNGFTCRDCLEPLEEAVRPSRRRAVSQTYGRAAVGAAIQNQQDEEDDPQVQQLLLNGGALSPQQQRQEQRHRDGRNRQTHEYVEDEANQELHQQLLQEALRVSLLEQQRVRRDQSELNRPTRDGQEDVEDDPQLQPVLLDEASPAANDEDPRLQQVLLDEAKRSSLQRQQEELDLRRREQEAEQVRLNELRRELDRQQRAQSQRHEEELRQMASQQQRWQQQEHHRLEERARQNATQQHERRLLQEEREMLRSVVGRATLLAKEVIKLVENSTYAREELNLKVIGRYDLIPLSEALMEHRAEFQRLGKPTGVTIGYHFTKCDNLKGIRRSGLMSASERKTELVTVSNQHGAYFGQGIYTANNPFCFQNYGNVGLLCATLHGTTKHVGNHYDQRNVSGNVNTVIGNKKRDQEPCFDEYVLRSKPQCLPLVRFSKSCITPNNPRAKGDYGADQLLWKLHVELQQLIDRFVHVDGDCTATVVPPYTYPSTARSSVARRPRSTQHSSTTGQRHQRQRQVNASGPPLAGTLAQHPPNVTAQHAQRNLQQQGQAQPATHAVARAGVQQQHLNQPYAGMQQQQQQQQVFYPHPNVAAHTAQVQAILAAPNQQRGGFVASSLQQQQQANQDPSQLWQQLYNTRTRRRPGGGLI